MSPVASGLGSGGPDTGDTTFGTTGAETTASVTSGTGSSDSGDGTSGDSTGGMPSGPEAFDEDPGWTAFNLPNGGNDYGWRATANAGGDPGEIGGFFQAPPSTSYYADVGAMSTSEAMIEASGTLDIVEIEGDHNNNTFIGHFSATDDGAGRLGFAVLDPNRVGEARITLVHGRGGAIAFTLGELGIDRSWSYVYDPDAGEYGEVTLTLEGQGSATAPLTAEDRLSILDLDAFGLQTPQSNNAGIFPGLLEVYLDDIEYTR